MTRGLCLGLIAGVLTDGSKVRNPIEGVWRALNAAGHDLPGYWDGEARRMRREAGRLGRAWFVESDWQSRVRELYDIAGEFDAILTAQGVDTYDIALRLRQQSE